MRRITRNERIRDIKPERERGPVEFKPHPLMGYEIFTQHLTRGDADHDPMFPQPTRAGVGAASWIGGLDPLPASPTPATPEPVQELQQYYEQLPPPPPEPEPQHNDHVMTYWMWRLDRMEAKRNG